MFYYFRNFKLYCLFLNSVIPIFDTANKFLQNEKPCVHILHSVLEKLLKDVLVRFVKPAVITDCPPYQVSRHAHMLDCGNLLKA